MVNREWRNVINEWQIVGFFGADPVLSKAWTVGLGRFGAFGALRERLSTAKS
jgi:hypothetical protein